MTHPSELHDAYDDTPPGAYTWLQAWFATQCNGDWEHGQGITIETLDNPGWQVRIDLRYSTITRRDFARLETYRTEHDWVVAWVDEDSYHAACGPLNLGEALFLFRVWVEEIVSG